MQNNNLPPQGGFNNFNNNSCPSCNNYGYDTNYINNNPPKLKNFFKFCISLLEKENLESPVKYNKGCLNNSLLFFKLILAISNETSILVLLETSHNNFFKPVFLKL